MLVEEFRIVRRAYSEYSFVENFTGNYVEATLHAMKLESINNDGEYFVRSQNQPDQIPGNSPDSQGEIAWV